MSIKKAFIKLFDKDFRIRVKKTHNPNGDGNASYKIVKTLYNSKIPKNKEKILY